MKELRVKALVLGCNHMFTVKRAKKQQIFSYGAGVYANDKTGVFPLPKNDGFIEPISIYRFHDPCPVGMKEPQGIATHIWWSRTLEQISGGKRLNAAWLKWVIVGGVFGLAAYFVFG